MSNELWLHNHQHKWTFEFTVSIFYPATLGVHKMVTQSCKCCTSMSHRFLDTRRRKDHFGIVPICLQWMIYQWNFIKYWKKVKFFASVIWFYTCINEISGEAEFLKSSQKNIFTVHTTHTYTQRQIVQIERVFDSPK